MTVIPNARRYAAPTSPPDPGDTGPGAMIYDGRFTGTFPAYQWDINPSARAGYNVYWSITQLAGQAPSGFDAVRWDAITQPFGDTGETGGWYLHQMPVTPTQGALWNIKFRFRLNGAQSWQRAWAEGGNGVIKAIVLGSDDNSGERLMTHIQAAPTPDQINIRSCQNIGACGDYVEFLSENTWHAGQMICQSSSTAGATDGFVALYLDNDNEGSPDGQTAGIAMPVDDWDVVGGLRMGNGTMRSILDGHLFSITMADCMIKTAFDPNWFGGM